jgi:hypothetical protein
MYFWAQMASLLILPSDVVRLLGSYLEFYDLLALSMSCRRCYHVLRALPALKEKVCFPFRPEVGPPPKYFKLTLEQCQTLAKMMESEASMFKICRAPSGHGKTWLLTALVCYKYLRVESQTRVIIVTSPATVKTFIGFWIQRIGFPTITNCQKCPLYNDHWRTQLLTTRVIITTQQLYHDVVQAASANGFPYAVYAKLPDETTLKLDKVHKVHMLEYVLFTSDNTKTPRRDFAEFSLSNSTLKLATHKPDFVTHPHVGVSKEKATEMKKVLETLGPSINEASAIRLITILSRHDLPEVAVMVKRGNVWLKDSHINYANTDREVSNFQVLTSMRKNPKMNAIVQLATQLYKQGKKLIVLDYDASYVVRLYYLLLQTGIDIYPYCTLYNPSSRGSMVAQFCKAQTGVLIAPMSLLIKDGISFTGEQDITFFRTPCDAETLDGVLGRCCRPKQVSPTVCHLFFTCALEERLFIEMLENEVINVKLDALQDELSKLEDLH